MAVLKCKECEYLDQCKIGKKTFYYCYHPDNYTIGRTIYAVDIKTSPKWCIKRVNSK